MPASEAGPRCPKCGRLETPNHAVTCPAQYAGAVGTTIDDRYVIESVLGQGGMGVVFRAEQTSVHRPVAVKMLHSSLATTSAFFERFRREAELASRLRHPHIISIYDFGRAADGGCYYVMELLEGENLRQKIRREGAFSLSRAVKVADQVARALGHAHAQNIVHRDLKPQNVMCTVVDNQDFIKVLDFGLVKMLEQEASGNDEEGLTSTGQILGTPQYMAPEQAAGDVVDQRADLYSLGVVTYYMITGITPYGQKSAHAALMAMMTEPIPPVSSYRPDAPLPESVDTFLRRALAYNRDDRPPTAEAFLEELQAAVKDIPPEVADARPARRDLVEPPSPSAQGTVAARGQKSGAASGVKPPVSTSSSRVVVGPVPGASGPMTIAASSRKPLIVGGVVAGIVALAVGAWVATSNHSSTQPRSSEVAAKPAVAAVPEPHPVVTVKVTTVPEGASVYDGALLLGVTPGTFMFPSERTAVNLTLKHDGYVPQTRGVYLAGAHGDAPVELSANLVTEAKSAAPAPTEPAPGRTKPKTKKVDGEPSIPTFGD